MSRKLTALDLITGLQSGDYLYVVRGDEDKRLLAPATLAGWGITDITAHGLLYTYDAAAPQAGIGAAFVKFTGFASEGHYHGVTVSAANDRITVAADGAYRIDFFVSFSGTVSTTFEFSVHVNQVDAGEIGLARRLGTGGDVGSASMGGILDLNAGDEIEIYVKADGAGKSITPQYAQLNVARVE